MDCMVQGVAKSRTQLSNFHLVPQTGIEPKSPALQSGFITTGLPWKSLPLRLNLSSFNLISEALRHGIPIVFQPPFLSLTSFCLYFRNTKV